MSVTIYHNPRCSKSRATLNLLQENGVNPVIVEYLKTPLSADELKKLLAKLQISPQDLIRKNEQIYKDLVQNRSDMDDDALINMMAEHPKLIERPIVETEKSARIGRPPEKILELF